MGDDGILGQISRGRVHQKVDAVVNHRNAQGVFDQRVALLAALEDPTQDYLQVLQTYAGVRHSEAAYLRSTWYNVGQEGWWHLLQPIQPVIRQGLIKAIKEATARNLPLDSYWIIGGEQVQVTVAVSAQQVNRIIHTPPCPPSKFELHHTQRVPIWAIKCGRGTEQAGEETREEIVEEVQGTVVVAQRKEFV